MRQKHFPIYLDYNATTPVAPQAIQAMQRVLDEHFGNPNSGTHPFGWYAEELVKIAREQLAALLNASTEEIYFTSGATEANNLALKGFAFFQRRNALLNGQKPVLASFITQLTEHKSVLDPIKRLSEEGHQAVVLEVDGQGGISFAALKRALEQCSSPTVVSLMLANNEVGTVHDIKRVAEICHGKGSGGVLLHCDATQAIGKMAVDVQELGVDMLSLSAHKFYGPKGVGALYLKKGIKLQPLFDGGSHERGLRAGTLNMPGIVALGVAAELAAKNHLQDEAKMRQLALRLWQKLREGLGEVRINGAALDFVASGPNQNADSSAMARLAGNLNVLLPQVPSARLLGSISQKVAFSTSSACQSKLKTASHVLHALGLKVEEQESSVRFSVGRATTEEEIDLAAEIVIEAARAIRRT